jgi:hypothetical protein
MKLYCNFGWLDGAKPGAAILWLMFALVVGGGCGKSHSTPPPVASPMVSDSTSSAPAPAATPPSVRIQSSVPSISANTGGPTPIQMLNRAMLGWEMKNHRRPHTFEEFAGSAGFQMPEPPPGLKYALDQRGFIVLVNSNQ